MGGKLGRREAGLVDGVSIAASDRGGGGVANGERGGDRERTGWAAIQAHKRGGGGMNFRVDLGYFNLDENYIILN